MSSSRHVALLALREIYQKEAYTDVALDRVLRQSNLTTLDRALATELVYGIVRRQRTLDTLINQLGKKASHQQPFDLRIILHLGLYQLRYLTQIPPSAAVHTSVEFAKENRNLKHFSGVVNGILRQYLRLSEKQKDPLQLPTDPVQKLGIFYSFPDLIIERWLEQFGQDETEKLCDWFNQPPTIDLRVNSLKTTIETVESAFTEVDITVERIPHLSQALRLTSGNRTIHQLPGFQAGWWTVQDSSAQLVTHLLDPQPGETIIDACAAPGGKTTHIAELMQDKGVIWACDRTASRLKKLQDNCQRLQLNSIKILTGDSRQFSQLTQMADRVLLDAPCSGWGTLHRHPDIRWRQHPDKIQEINQLQQELLNNVANWVKPGGFLVYATCTLNSLENENLLQKFLSSHHDWQIEFPSVRSPAFFFTTPAGWIKVLPYQHQMDGFFMVKLKKG